MNPAAQLLLFADLMLKSTLVLALALLAARLWRAASAANRHLIWLAAFALLLLLPFTLLVTPRWSWQPGATGAGTLHGTPALWPAQPGPGPKEVVQVSTPVAFVATPAIMPPPARATADPTGFVPRNWWLLGWLAGVTVLLARLGVGAGQLWSWRRRSTLLDDDRAQALARRIAGEYELTRAVELRASAWCRVPMTWGTISPVVLLPADAANWPEPRLALVLRHELGHIARHDCLARLVAQLAAIFYWPNPLGWVAHRALRLEQEQACDDLVLAAGTPAKTYALELVASTRLLHGSRQPAPAVAIGEQSTLGRRIENIIGDQRDRRPLARRTVGLASLAAVLMLVGFTSAQVRDVEVRPATPPTGTGDPFATTPETATTPATPVQDTFESTYIKIGQSDFEFNDPGHYGVAHPAPGVLTLNANKSIGQLDLPSFMHTPPQRFAWVELNSGTKTAMATPVTPVQVAIESAFIKIDQGEFEFNELLRYGAAHPGPGALNENNWIGRLDVPAFLHTLEKKLGYEELSRPAFTVLSGKRANMSVAQELRYPQSYSDSGEPQNYTTRNVGLQLAATATVAADGHTINLHLNPRTTEFEGFVQYGTKGVQPIFSTHEMDTEISMEDGTTVVMGGLALPDKPNTGEVSKPADIEKLITGSPSDAKKRMLLVIITARIVKQGDTAQK